MDNLPFDKFQEDETRRLKPDWGFVGLAGNLARGPYNVQGNVPKVPNAVQQPIAPRQHQDTNQSFNNPGAPHLYIFDLQDQSISPSTNYGQQINTQHGFNLGEVSYAPLPGGSNDAPLVDFGHTHDGFNTGMSDIPSNLNYQGQYTSFTSFQGPYGAQTLPWDMGQPANGNASTLPDFDLGDPAGNFIHSYPATDAAHASLNRNANVSLHPGAPIVPQPASASHISDETPKLAPQTAPIPKGFEENRIRCPEGCQGTFGRGAEYRRHKKMHEPHPYRCVVPTCEKTFYRLDKLRSHARLGHKIAL